MTDSGDHPIADLDRDHASLKERQAVWLLVLLTVAMIFAPYMTAEGQVLAGVVVIVAVIFLFIVFPKPLGSKIRKTCWTTLALAVAYLMIEPAIQT